MPSNLMPSFCQCWLIDGISSVKSRNVKPLKPAVWVDKTAEGNMQVSTPQAEMIGKATVNEHWPTQEMS